MDEVRPATGQALIEPFWPSHRDLNDAIHRAFLLRSKYFAISKCKKQLIHQSFIVSSGLVDVLAFS